MRQNTHEPLAPTLILLGISSATLKISSDSSPDDQALLSLPSP